MRVMTAATIAALVAFLGALPAVRAKDGNPLGASLYEQCIGSSPIERLACLSFIRGVVEEGILSRSLCITRPVTNEELIMLFIKASRDTPALMSLPRAFSVDAALLPKFSCS